MSPDHSLRDVAGFYPKGLLSDIFHRFDASRPYTRPSRKYMGDAGYDLYAAKDAIINPMSTVNIPFNVRVDFPVGWFGLIQERSSQGLHGVLTLGNVIDEGYENEISANLLNTGKQAIIVHQGDRVAQLVLVPRFIDPAEPTLPLRGTRGFGSTGR